MNVNLAAARSISTQRYHANNAAWAQLPTAYLQRPDGERLKLSREDAQLTSYLLGQYLLERLRDRKKRADVGKDDLIAWGIAYDKAWGKETQPVAQTNVIYQLFGANAQILTVLGSPVEQPLVENHSPGTLEPQAQRGDQAAIQSDTSCHK